MNEWISINDRLPIYEDHEWVLLSDGDRIWLGQIEYHLSKEFFCKCCLENLYGVTHWMEAPKPPLQ